MNRVEAKALREERAQVIADQRKLLDAAAEAKRDLTGEEEKSYADMEARTAKLEKDIARVEKLEAEERAMAASQGTVTRTDLPPAAARETMSADEKSARRAKNDAAVHDYMRNGVAGMTPENRAHLLALQAEMPPELRAQSTTTTAGGYLVPDDTSLAARLEDALLAYGGMRAVAEVIGTSTGAELAWPTTNDTSNEGEIITENSAHNEQDITFGQLLLNSYLYSSKIIRVSVQLLQDSAINVDGLIGGKLGDRLGRITNRHYTRGTGSSQPNGIVTASTAGKTAASSSTLTGDELIDLIHSVDPAYRTAAMFMFHDTTLQVIKKLKDSNNRYLFLPGLEAREPDGINGYRFQINQHMPTIEASAKSIIFGDLRKYIIRDVRGFTLLRLVERYAEYLQVGFLAFMRTDGELSDAGTRPVKHLVHPSP